MLKGLGDGETDPAALAALADYRLRSTQEELRDALGACAELHPVYRKLLKMSLEELQLMDEQIKKMDQEMAGLLEAHQQAIQRLAEVPGLGCDSGQQIITQVGPTAATFSSAKDLCSRDVKTVAGFIPLTSKELCEEESIYYFPRRSNGCRPVLPSLDQVS